MKKTLIFLHYVLFLFTLQEYANAEADPTEDNIATFDVSGPPFNPAELKVRELLKKYQECSFIDWKGGTGPDRGTPQIIHNFDRPLDSQRLFDLIEMSEELSNQWNIKKAWYDTRTKERVSDWFDDPKDSQLKFIPHALLKKLRNNGYLIQFKPFVKMSGKLTPVPNWQNLYYLPTQCGTLVFVKYKPICDKYLAPKNGDFDIEPRGRETKAKAIRFDRSDINESTASVEYEIESEPLFFLENVYPPTFHIDSISEGFVIKEHQAFWENVTQTLQTAQIIAEIFPFAAVVRTTAQTVDTGWWEHKPLVTVADRAGLAADVLLDSIPILAQASKFRKVSKTMFIAGSAGALSTSIGTKIGAQGELKIDDYARLIVLGIISRDFRAMKVSDRTKDLEKAFRETRQGVTDEITKEGIEGAIDGVKGTAKYSKVIEENIAKTNSKFEVPKDIADESEALVKTFRLRHLFPQVATHVVDYFKRNKAFFEEAVTLLKNSDPKNPRIDSALQAKYDELLESTLRKITPNSTDKKINYLIENKDEAIKDFPLHTLVESSKILKNQVDNFGNLTAEQKIKLFQKLSVNAGDVVYLNKLRAKGVMASYSPPHSTINLYRAELPDHYILRNGKFEPFILPKGATLPYTGPNGEFVGELKNIVDDFPEFFGEMKDEVNIMLKSYNLSVFKSSMEEIQHAANHAHDIVTSLKVNDLEIHMYGVGYFREDLREYADELGLTIATLVQNKETVKCLSWIKSLSAQEILEVISKSSSSRYSVVGDKVFDKINSEIIDLPKLRTYLTDSSELDIMMSFHKASIDVSTDFVKDRYLVRILGKEFLDRGLHKN